MTKITLKMVLMLGVLAVLVVGVSGCTGIQNPLTGGQTSQVNAYANAFVSSFKANLGPGDSLVSSNVVQNGSDAMQVTLTVANTTPTSIWSNGSMDTYALNIKQFDNTNDASNFYNSTTFGYNPGAATGGVSTTNNTNAYEQVLGHAPTISRYATQIVSLSLLGGSINVAAQQGEFVIYGTATVVPGASGSAASSAAPSPSTSLTPTPMPTLVPTSTPTPTPTPTLAPTYEVQISGSVINNTGYFYATVTNSAGVSQTLNWQLNWFLNGQLAGGTWTPSGGITVPLTPGVQYTVTATYLTPAQWPNVGSTLATSAPFYVTG